MREKRISRVVEVLERQGLHACIIKGMDNIFYLTGFRGSEGTAVVTRGDVLLLVDSRYITYAREVAQGCVVIETKGKDGAMEGLFQRYGVTRTGFDSNHTTFEAYRSLREGSPSVEFVPVAKDLESVRQCKEPEEVLAIRKAISIATAAFTAVFEKIVPGRTEKAIASDLEYAMRSLGAEGASFETIVASGPRSRSPTDSRPTRPLRRGKW